MITITCLIGVTGLPRPAAPVPDAVAPVLPSARTAAPTARPTSIDWRLRTRLIALRLLLVYVWTAQGYVGARTPMFTRRDRSVIRACSAGLARLGPMDARLLRRHRRDRAARPDVRAG